MNKNEKFVITLNRELGSGGRTIGRLIAERLGVPFYDKALINALEEKYGLTTDEIERMKGRSHSWWADFKRAMNIGAELNAKQYSNYQIDAEKLPDALSTDEIFATEQEVLRGIAADESCVIAGRCGFYVFREHPNHLSILIQASMESRVARVASKRNITPEKARDIIEHVDKMRENYVNKYTGTSRYDTRNYDIVLRVDGKTEEELADIIMQYIK
ncbi:MAG: cytidylate kinase-like family protein [Prevotella sp.]|nr:cytidylate kinase-like family protein [Prevotella sp.]